MRKSSWLVVGILLSSAASVLLAGEYFVKHKGDKRRGEPVEGMGLVYVFRPASMGAAIKTWTFADDQLIGVTKAKGYSFAQVPEGQRLIWSKAENTSVIETHVESGQTYYFKTAIKMGVGKARVKLVELSEEEAERLFDRCSYCEPTEEGRARGLEIAAQRIDKAQEKAVKRAEKQKASD